MKKKNEKRRRIRRKDSLRNFAAFIKRHRSLRRAIFVLAILGIMVFLLGRFNQKLSGIVGELSNTLGVVSALFAAYTSVVTLSVAEKLERRTDIRGEQPLAIAIKIGGKDKKGKEIMPIGEDVKRFVVEKWKKLADDTNTPKKQRNVYEMLSNNKADNRGKVDCKRIIELVENRTKQNFEYKFIHKLVDNYPIVDLYIDEDMPDSDEGQMERFANDFAEQLEQLIDAAADCGIDSTHIFFRGPMGVLAIVSAKLANSMKEAYIYQSKMKMVNNELTNVDYLCIGQIKS